MDDNYFEVKYIPKKRGFRKIVTYSNINGVNEVKILHIKIKQFIEKNSKPSVFVKSYTKHRSIIKNAKAHMYNDVFIMVDIKRYFNNINHNRLIETLFYELNKTKEVIDYKECGLIVKECTVGSIGLPIGLITSPILSNLYLKEFDNIAFGKLRKMNINNPIYTRYADDLTISFKEDERKEILINDILHLLETQLKRYGLKLNDKKTRIISLSKSNHVKITGINITKGYDDYRTLSTGKKRKNELYKNALTLIKQDKDKRNRTECLKVKGMQSFILSVEKRRYEDSFSEGMKIKISELGYASLKELIDDL